jgi:hypothetical protein
MSRLSVSVRRKLLGLVFVGALGVIFSQWNAPFAVGPGRCPAIGEPYAYPYCAQLCGGRGFCDGGGNCECGYIP